MSTGDDSDGYSGNVTTAPSDCSRLFLTTPINTPVPDVVERLSVGDQLTIELLPEGDDFVVNALFEGQIAGAITGEYLIKLMECLRNHVPFIGIVTESDGGRCLLQIRPAARS